MNFAARLPAEFPPDRMSGLERAAYVSMLGFAAARNSRSPPRESCSDYQPFCGSPSSSSTASASRCRGCSGRSRPTPV